MHTLSVSPLTCPGSLMTSLLSALTTGFDHTIIIPDSSPLATFEDRHTDRQMKPQSTGGTEGGAIGSYEPKLTGVLRAKFPTQQTNQVWYIYNLVEAAGTEGRDGGRVTLEVPAEHHLGPSGRDVEHCNVSLRGAWRRGEGEGLKQYPYNESSGDGLPPVPISGEAILQFQSTSPAATVGMHLCVL